MIAPLSLTLAMAAALSPASDPAELLPSSSLLYMGTDSIKAGAAASENTAMAKILGEAEVRAFMHKPTAAAESILNSILAEAAGSMGDEMGEGLSIPQDVKLDFDSSASGGMNIGAAFLALTHFTMPTSEDNPVPDIGLLVGLELFDSSHVDMLRALWGAFDAPQEEGNHGGIDFMAKMIPETPLAVHLAFLGDTAIISLSADALFGVIDRFQGTAPEGTSLAADVDYQAVLAATGGSSMGGSTNFARVGGLMQIVQMGATMRAAESGEPEQAQSIAELFASIGLDAIKVAGGTSSVGSDGLIHTMSAVSIDSSAPGLVPGMVKAGGSIDRQLITQVPNEALGASFWTMGTELVAIYDFTMEAVETLEPGTRGEIEGMIDAYLNGASLRDDLLGNFHGDSISYSIPGQGFPGTPEQVVKTNLHNEQGLVTVLEALAKLVSDEAGMPVRLTSSDHEGGTIYELDLSATPVGAVMQPAFAVKEGQMVFSNQVRRLKSTLNAGTAQGETLDTNPGLASFLDSLGKDAQLASVSFTDTDASFRTQYGQIAGFLPMVGAMAGDVPVDFSKLPPEQAVAQHLTESYSATYTDSNGYIVSSSVSQFQAADFVPLAIVACLVGIGRAEGIQIEEAEQAIDPAEQATIDLRELKAACTVYKITTGGYPESLEDLLAPLPDYEDGALPRDTLPVDPWGNSYHFALEAPPGKSRAKPKLWSNGPDGVDNGGEGDDVLKFN